VTSEHVSKDTRFLMVQLFSVEAAWAYAMQMKQVTVSAKRQEATHFNQGDSMAQRNPNRLRVHAAKRLKRAFKLAEDL
jgi:hypothetical protein